MPKQKRKRNRSTSWGAWFRGLLIVAVVGGALYSVFGCVAKSDIAPIVKGISDELLAHAESAIETQAAAGRDLLQEIRTTNRSSTVSGVPWYGLAALGLVVLGAFVGLAGLMFHWGYHRKNWQRKTQSSHWLGLGGAKASGK